MKQILLLPLLILLAGCGTTTTNYNATEAFINHAQGADNFTATYTMSAQGTSMTQTLAIKGDNFLLQAQDPTTGVRSMMIIKDKELISCADQTGEWLCYSFGEASYEENEYSMSTRMAQLKEGIKEYNITKAQSKTIAGTKTECFNIQGTEVKQTICYTPSNVPLYLEVTTAQGSSTQEAISYEDDIGKEAFNPPATPQEVQEEELNNLIK